MITDRGLSIGPHDIIIRAGDISGQQANIDEIPVNFFCIEDFTNFDSFGDFAVGEALLVSGTANVKGWALDVEGVQSVRILIDGVHVGDAAYGFSLPAVTMLHPSFPDSLAPGFQFLLDTTQLTNGDHTVGVEVVDAIPGVHTRTLIGERRFRVFNPVE